MVTFDTVIYFKEVVLTFFVKNLEWSLVIILWYILLLFLGSKIITF